MKRRNDAHIMGATSEQLATLLSLAASPSQGTARLPDVVVSCPGCRQLLASIPVDGFGNAEQLLDAICAPEASATSHQRMMERTRDLMLRESDSDKRHALTFIYHVATAAAFARHGLRLTRTPIEERLDLYESLAGIWAAEPTGRVFEAAIERAVREEMGDDDKLP